VDGKKPAIFYAPEPPFGRLPGIIVMVFMFLARRRRAPEQSGCKSGILTVNCQTPANTG